MANRAIPAQRNASLGSSRTTRLSPQLRVPSLSQTRGRLQTQADIRRRARAANQQPLQEIRLPERSRRAIHNPDDKLRDIDNANRRRFDELGQGLGLPEGVDPGKVPGRGHDPRRQPNLAHTTETYDRMNEASDVSGRSWMWGPRSVLKAMDWGSDSGPLDQNDPVHEWGSGDSDLDDDGSDDDPDGSADGDADGGDSGADGDLGDDDAYDYDFANQDPVDMDFSNDPVPEGDDPDELRGFAHEIAMARGAASAAGTATGSRSTGGKTRTQPGAWLPGESARDRWLRLTRGNPDPEGGGPAELGATDQSRVRRGATHQPTPDGEDPDDPRAGEGRDAGQTTATSSLNLSKLLQRLQPTPEDQQGSGGPVDPRAGR